MDTLHDPEFGTIQIDGSLWILEQQVRFNGADIPLRIEPEEGEARTLSDVQRQAIRLALALPSDVLAAAVPAVVQNYEVYREMIGDEELPPLQSPTDVWETVEPSYIEVPAHGTTTIPTFLLFAECDWEPEHGLVVRFRNGQADAAHQQGELGL
jgi:hypothetical protein